MSHALAAVVTATIAIKKKASRYLGKYCRAFSLNSRLISGQEASGPESKEVNRA